MHADFGSLSLNRQYFQPNDEVKNTSNYRLSFGTENDFCLVQIAQRFGSVFEISRTATLQNIVVLVMYNGRVLIANDYITITGRNQAWTRCSTPALAPGYTNM